MIWRRQYGEEWDALLGDLYRLRELEYGGNGENLGAFDTVVDILKSPELERVLNNYESQTDVVQADVIRTMSSLRALIVYAREHYDPESAEARQPDGMEIRVRHLSLIAAALMALIRV